LTRPLAPRTLDELLARARALDGLQVGELARRVRLPLPAEARSAKGHIGRALELALGADAGSLDEPDFLALGVELKSIPLDELGRVRESTFVCNLELERAALEEWERSRVRRKLGCVLWVPVQAAPVELPERHIGTPRLWRPSREQEALLRADWELLMGRIAAGGIDELTAHDGEALQVRPKGPHGRVRAAGRGPEGEALEVMPRGFYLRARFTEAILWST
jgi:DNA mismatch repair protein MutH